MLVQNSLNMHASVPCNVLISEFTIYPDDPARPLASNRDNSLSNSDRLTAKEIKQLELKTGFMIVTCSLCGRVNTLSSSV